MPRQDIYFNAPYGEVETTDNLTNKFIYPFLFLGEMEGMNNEKSCYGEVIVPVGFEKKFKEGTEVRSRIPYLPVYKELYVRFRLELDNGKTEYLLNPLNNQLWFPVYLISEEEKQQPIYLSEYIRMNENGNFNLVIKDGYLALFSGDETDFYIKAALPQNEVFLLKAMSGNLYSHPTTGVGLIEFLHGNFENTGLATRLQQEFAGDKMIVNNAYMDSNTGELYLDVKEKNG